VAAFPARGRLSANNEFVFLVVIARVLDIFLRPLLPNSFFSIIRFGSSSDALFQTCTPHNEESAALAMALASIMQASLGWTVLLKK
jgi:hypothetical protein